MLRGGWGGGGGGGGGVVNDNKLKALLSLKAQISDDQALSLSLSVVVFVLFLDF